MRVYAGREGDRLITGGGEGDEDEDEEVKEDEERRRRRVCDRRGLGGGEQRSPIVVEF